MIECIIGSVSWSFHNVSLADRKKDLVKLQHGEYVSLCKVETALKLCPLVDNVCIYAESTKCFTVALVVPNHKNLEAAAKRIGVSTDIEWNDLCSHSDIESHVLSTLVEYGVKCELFSSGEVFVLLGPCGFDAETVNWRDAK